MNVAVNARSHPGRWEIGCPRGKAVASWGANGNTFVDKELSSPVSGAAPWSSRPLLSLLPSPAGRLGGPRAANVPVTFPVFLWRLQSIPGQQTRGGLEGGSGGAAFPPWHLASPTSSCSPGSHVLLSRELPFDEPLFSLSF